jgi:hypothetical protein
MLVSAWITKMRTMVRDISKYRGNSWDGDGTTLVFQLTNYPVLESSYTVKVGGVVKTEVTHYTLDKDTGLLTFTKGNAPADGSDNVTIDYKYVNQRDNDWMDIYNAVIEDVRDNVFAEAINDSALTVAANTYDYSLAPIDTTILDILSVETRSVSSEPWSDITKGERSFKFLEDLNKLRIEPYFSTAGDAIRIHYTYAFDECTAVGDTVSVTTKFMNMFNHYAASYYFQRIVPNKLTETAIVTKERTFHPADMVIKIADFHRQEGDRLMKLVRPARRPKNIITKSRF